MEYAAIDSSVLVAILNQEETSAHFGTALINLKRHIGRSTIFETRIWCIRKLGNASQPWLEDLLKQRGTQLADFDASLEALATDAYARFGKGRHPAALNFGDCMAYAVAKHHDVPLLFKGADFGKTDVKIHPASIMED